MPDLEHGRRMLGIVCWGFVRSGETQPTKQRLENVRITLFGVLHGVKAKIGTLFTTLVMPIMIMTQPNTSRPARQLYGGETSD